MAVLDAILVAELINVPTTVNSNFSTDSIDISNRQDEFSVQINYDSGSTVDMNFLLEVSNDNINFSTMGTQNVTDTSGTHLFDVTGGTGTRYLRISIEVITGSIDVQRILYDAKRLH